MPTPPGVGSENLANPMFIALVGAANAALPTTDIWGPGFDITLDPTSPSFPTPTPVTLAELTTAIDAIQGKFVTMLNEQSDAHRITQGDYAKTLVQLSQVSVQAAVQFVLGKDTAFWSAIKVRNEAIGAKTANELTRWQIMLARAQFARAKQELSNSDSQFGVTELNRTGLLPAQVLLTQEQHEAARAQTLGSRSDSSAIAGVLGGQIALVSKQILMVHEQMEGQRAQTLDTRQDGQTRATTVTLPDGTNENRLQGLLGVQNYLYRQQILSYREDGKVKAAKLFSDLWMTMKTMEEATQPSNYFRPPTDAVPTTPMDSVFESVRKIAAPGTTFTP
jgi:hypothetical protein